jgi:hypothetical protein
MGYQPEYDLTTMQLAFRVGQHLVSDDETRMPSVYLDPEKSRDVRSTLATLGWQPESDNNFWEPYWIGRYVKDGQLLHVGSSRTSVSDVEGYIGDRHVVVVCGDWAQVRSGHDEALFALTIGRAMLLEAEESDLVVVALPKTSDMVDHAETFEGRPAARRSGIRIALVGEDGTVTGMSP